MITKVSGIRVSERVFSILDEFLQYETSNGHKLYAYLQTFYNCREQGYYLTVADDDLDNPNRVQENLYIFVCEARSSDNILVVIQTEYPDGHYSEDAWNNKDKFNNTNYFGYDEEHKAADFIYKKIKEFLKLGD